MDFEILGCVVVIQRKVVVQQNGFTMSYRFKNRLKGYNKKSHRFRLKCVPSIWIIDIDFEWPSRMGIRFVPWSLELATRKPSWFTEPSRRAEWRHWVTWWPAVATSGILWVCQELATIFHWWQEQQQCIACRWSRPWDGFSANRGAEDPENSM
jgi:hypothetical protein